MVSRSREDKISGEERIRKLGGKVLELLSMWILELSVVPGVLEGEREGNKDLHMALIRWQLLCAQASWKHVCVCLFVCVCTGGMKVWSCIEEERGYVSLHITLSGWREQDKSWTWEGCRGWGKASGKSQASARAPRRTHSTVKDGWDFTDGGSWVSECTMKELWINRKLDLIRARVLWSLRGWESTWKRKTGIVESLWWIFRETGM